MAKWQGSTKAPALASGALIYVHRDTLGVLPSAGMSLRVRHDDGGETAGTIVSASPDVIRFEAGDVTWTIGPASEAAPTVVEDGRILEAWIVT